MLEQITKGIKVIVNTIFNGIIYRESEPFYYFSYYITIENNSKNTVKLLERFWVIYDTLNNTEYVKGEGVIGEVPILKPNEVFNYKSNCFLLSSIGAMKGNYKMVNIETDEDFLVIIPTFQLITNANLN
ncbi:Co2+/Mg2+ efflux protein ApaG [Tenacibaculum aestuariivivum]|uniref:Co2+/Mg2+ efflux protein ApaG n=1 Tax=Tenacibaculum aestuariivivum TaxID=2006131 RepID=UPI003AB4EE64